MVYGITGKIFVKYPHLVFEIWPVEITKKMCGLRRIHHWYCHIHFGKKT